MYRRSLKPPTDRQVRFSGGNRVGSFLLWTGDAGYEEAEFSFEFSWRLREYDRDFLIVSFDLLPLLNLLGAERVHMLTLLMNSQDPIQPGMLFWRKLLMSMSAVEELELCRCNARIALCMEYKTFISCFPGITELACGASC
jgi:hypothetical protein